MDKSKKKKKYRGADKSAPRYFFRVRLRTGCRRIVWTVS